MTDNDNAPGNNYSQSQNGLKSDFNIIVELLNILYFERRIRAIIQQQEQEKKRTRKIGEHLL